MLYVEQIKAARALVGWNQATLAKAGGLSLSTIKNIETGSGRLRTSTNTAWKLQRALEGAGVTFIDATNYSGPGVMLSKPIHDPDQI